MRRIVVVGASLAGLRTAEALRAQGFAGELTLVGDEPHMPYDRPPLSKELRIAPLDVAEDLDARWLIGRRAVGLDIGRRTVALEGGDTAAYDEIGYDGLVIATGTAARQWPGQPLPQGVFTLRGLDDTLALRAELTEGRRLVVVGAGFLGSELAAAARELGLEVTLIEAAEQPLQRAAGSQVGAYVAELHRAAGIALHTGCTVREFRTAPGTDRIGSVTLDDGTSLPADLAVLALGAEPATGWLAGSGLRLGGGVHADAYLRVLRADGVPEPGIVAAGDVVNLPQPLAGGARLALGHWADAVEHAGTAAYSLLNPADPRPHQGIPSFWSDLHGVKFRSVGLPAAADEVRVVELDVASRRVEVTYHFRGRLVGALTARRTGRLAAYRQELAPRVGEFVN